MFKKFFNSSTKNSKVLTNKIKFNNFLKSENFSMTDKTNLGDKRIKLSEIFTNKKEDTNKKKILQFTPISKKVHKDKTIGSSEVIKDDSESKQLALKNSISDKEDQKTTKQIEPKTLKVRSISRINEEFKSKLAIKNEDFESDNSVNKESVSDSKSKLITMKIIPKRYDNQAPTSKSDVDENKKKFFEREKVDKPIKVLKKNIPRRFDPINSLNYNDHNLNDLQTNGTIPDQSIGFLNQQDLEFTDKQKAGEEDEILRYMCVPLNMQKIEDIKYKWQQFFINSSRVIPDINRSINNKPDGVYYEYIRDLMDEFTDKQLLFAIKNIFLNEDLIKGYEILSMMRDLYYRLKTDGTFDVSSKVNIIMLYEVFFLYDLIEYKLKNEENSINNINNNIMQMIQMVTDYQRFFFPEYRIEECLMILKTMMDKNVIDIYMVKKFLMHYSEKDIVNTLKECTYKIKYFNTEYNMNLAIFYILDNYIKVCKINNEWESIDNQFIKFLIKRLILEFLNLMKEDKILLKDIIFNNFRFENLVSVFNLDQADIFKQSINNALLSKVFKELKLISEDKILITDGRTITQSVDIISRMKKNTYKENLFKETYLLLSDLIYENYTASLLSTLNEESKFDDPHNSCLLLIYDTWIDGLLEAAIENDICDFNILEPFMVLLHLRIQKYKIDSNSTSIIKKLSYLGKYNFNEVLQSEKFNSNILKNYFKILDELRNFLPKYLDQIKNNFKTAITTNKFNTNNSTLNLDQETFKILNKFYTDFFEKQPLKTENNNYGLHYEEDFELSTIVNPYLMRFKIIPKEMYMISYLPNFDFRKTLSQELRTDFNKDILINYSKLVFGVIATSIKYNIFTIKLANAFINFIITIYSDRTNIYANYILEDLDLYRDFNFILTHIFNPEDNFIAKSYQSIKNKKAKNNTDKKSGQTEEDIEMNLNFLQNLYIIEETVMKSLKDKYDIRKYDLKEKEDFDIHSQKINALIFKDAITEFIEEDEEIQIFLDKYLEEEAQQKHSLINFSNSHSNFINLFKTKNESEIDEDTNYFKDENSNGPVENNESGGITISLFKNKRKTNPNDLYYEVNQIKTFANVKSVIFNNNKLSEAQIENLLNDEILFCKILLDMKKISLVINEILKRVSIQDLTDYFNNFFNPNFLTTSRITDELKKISSELSESLLNLSSYSILDIAKSNLFYKFLNKFLYVNSKMSNKKNFPITDVDKNDLVLYNYPIFPMIVPYIVQKSQEKDQNSRIDVYQKSQFYKCSSSTIRTQKSYEDFLFLKALLRNQEKNINIYEYNDMI